MAYLNTAAAYAAILAAKDTGNPADKVTWTELSNILRSISDDIDSLRTIEANYVSTALSYSNPTWLTGLAWSKISGTPTSLAGYGITDPIVLTSGSYANPSWITSLAYSKLTGAPVLGTVAAINTNGNGSTYLAGDGTWKTIDLSNYVTLSGAQTISGAKTFSPTITASGGLATGTTLSPNLNVAATNDWLRALRISPTVNAGGFTSYVAAGLTIDMSGALTNAVMIEFVSGASVNRIRHATNQFLFDARINTSLGVFVRSTSTSNLNVYGIDAVNNTLEFMANGQKGAIFPSTGNWVIQNGGAFIDAGFRLDVNGTLRATGLATLSGGVVVGGSSLNASAVAQFDSTSKGVLVPRMTTAQRTAIASPATGLIVYDTDLAHICYYDGSSWRKISHSAA